MHALTIPFLLLAGSLLAVQAAANVQLSGAMASPFGASTLQLAIGAGLLAASAAVAGSLGAFGLLGEAEPWQLLGGLGSAVYITAGILLFPRLGAVVAVGLIVAGQMLASLLLDGFGWLGVERNATGVAGLAGAAAVVAGAWLIVRAQAGVAMLGDAARGPLALGATVAAGAPRPRVVPLGRVPWWGWLGGLCGATYVTSVFVSIPEIGAAPVVALTVAGQQLASVLVDRFGLLRLPRRHISRRRLTGVAVLLAGVLLVTLA